MIYPVGHAGADQGVFSALSAVTSLTARTARFRFGLRCEPHYREAVCSSRERLSVPVDEQHPRFLHAVDLNIDIQLKVSALICFFRSFGHAASLQIPCRHLADVLQRDRPVSAERLSGCKVIHVSLFEERIRAGDAVDHGIQNAVPDPFGPAAVDHPELGRGRIPLLAVPEVSDAEREVGPVHRKLQLFDAVRIAPFVHVPEAFKHCPSGPLKARVSVCEYPVGHLSLLALSRLRPSLNPDVPSLSCGRSSRPPPAGSAIRPAP